MNFKANKSAIVTMFMLLILNINPTKSEGPQEQSVSLFSIFKGDTQLQDAVNDIEHTAPNVRTFYHYLKGEPVWFSQGRLTNLGKVAIDVLKNADQEGLNVADYIDATQIEDQPENWIQTELLLTTRFLEFIDDVRTGRIDPMKISGDIKFHSPKTHAIELLLDAVHDKDPNASKLRQMAPHLPQYQYLKSLLADYREQATSPDHWPKLTTNKTLKMGDHDPEINTLRQLLVLHAVLSPDQATGNKFDESVSIALREFQKRYSLEPDGVVGPKTREILNYSIHELIKRIIVNMERLRWLPDDLGHKHIIINVAGYVLQGFEDSEATIMMPVIVGRPDRRTPLFYAILKNIVLNPSWGVPHSIYIHDKLPKIRKDRGYVERSKFTILDRQGRVVDPDAADWTNEGKNYFLRQCPGRHNALGQIKFNIENPYTIYMHGTPNQHLFAKKARAFSSGCIRLKHPLKLAAWVLNHDVEWTCDSLENAINTGQTQTVKPSEYIPVYFTYQTIWIKDNKKGKRIFFSNDPYQLDAKMIKMLKVTA
jgi:murein L,D-transpeptidase YcbB/YkuD